MLKTANVATYVDPELLERLREAAKRDHRSMSSFVRKVLDQACPAPLQEARQ